jgi:3-oxoacyl-[acyl-carrier protein] reductase
VKYSLEEDAHVYFCARSEPEIKAAEASFKAQFPACVAVGSAVDVTSPSQVEKWVAEIAEQKGRVDVVVSNVSSISVTDSKEAWSAAYSTDMLGTVSLIQAALPHLLQTKGCIVTISSVSGRDVDFTAPSPYGAFKAALIHYSAQLAHTLAPKGVRANCVSPGNIYIADGVCTFFFFL